MKPNNPSDDEQDDSTLDVTMAPGDADRIAKLAKHLGMTPEQTLVSVLELATTVPKAMVAKLGLHLANQLARALRDDPAGN